MEAKKNLILNLTLAFALEIIAYCEGLEQQKDMSLVTNCLNPELLSVQM